MTTAPTRRAFGYVRVSTEEQALLGSSVDAQAAQVRQTAEACGWELVDVFIDAGVSGGKPLSSRPGGRKLLDALGEGDTVIAVKLDRLFRNTVDAITRATEWRESGVHLAVEGLDTTTAIGRAMFGVLAVFAEFERDRNRERTLSVTHYRKSQGKVVGQVPMGSAVGPDGQTLVPNEEELAVLDRILELREQHPPLSFAAIADILNSERAPKKRGGSWSRGAVHYLYHNACSSSEAAA